MYCFNVALVFQTLFKHAKLYYHSVSQPLNMTCNDFGQFYNYHTNVLEAYIVIKYEKEKVLYI